MIEGAKQFNKAYNFSKSVSLNCYNKKDPTHSFDHAYTSFSVEFAQFRPCLGKQHLILSFYKKNQIQFIMSNNCIRYLLKLDGVGLVDNRPFTD